MTETRSAANDKLTRKKYSQLSFGNLLLSVGELIKEYGGSFFGVQHSPGANPFIWPRDEPDNPMPLVVMTLGGVRFAFCQLKVVMHPYTRSVLLALDGVDISKLVCEIDNYERLPREQQLLIEQAREAVDLALLHLFWLVTPPIDSNKTPGSNTYLAEKIKDIVDKAKKQQGLRDETYYETLMKENYGFADLSKTFVKPSLVDATAALASDGEENSGESLVTLHLQHSGRKQKVWSAAVGDSCKYAREFSWQPGVNVNRSPNNDLKFGTELTTRGDDNSRMELTADSKELLSVNDLSAGSVPKRRKSDDSSDGNFDDIWVSGLRYLQITVFTNFEGHYDITLSLQRLDDESLETLNSMHAAFASGKADRASYNPYEHQSLFIKLKNWIRIMEIYRVLDAPIDQVIRLQMIVLVKGERFQIEESLSKPSNAAIVLE